MQKKQAVSSKEAVPHFWTWNLRCSFLRNRFSNHKQGKEVKLESNTTQFLIYSMSLHYIVLATGFAAMWLGQSVTLWTNAERKPRGTHQSAQLSPWMEHQTHSETQIITQPLTEVEKESAYSANTWRLWDGQTQSSRARFKLGFLSYRQTTLSPAVPRPLVRTLSSWQGIKPSVNLALEEWICPSRYACYTLYFVFSVFLYFSFTLTVNLMLSRYNMSCHSRVITKWLKFLTHSIHCMYISNSQKGYTSNLNI